MDDRSSARPDAAFAQAPRPTPPKKPLRPSERPGIRRAAPSAAPEPTILLVGADTAFEAALRAALVRHRVHVETAPAESVAETVLAAAPDLLLLVGPAAKDGGSAVLGRLVGSAACAVVPVAILDDNAALDSRLRAFRHGAAAVIAPSASVDAIAEQVAKLAREIPERGSESLGVVGEATLSELVSELSRELRCGILSVHTGQGQAPGDGVVRLVLGGGRPPAASIDDFVSQVKAHAGHAEALRYEFAEHVSGTVALLDTHPASSAHDEPERARIDGVRVALADEDTGRADAVAQELRARGASVVVTDLAPAELRFGRLRQVDPQVLLIGESELKGPGYELLRRMRRDTRLRWVSLLVVRWDELWSDALSVAATDRLSSALATLSKADSTLQARAAAGESFVARLEVTGPARCLRALSISPRPLRVTVDNPRVTVHIDLSDGLVVGAAAELRLDAAHHWDGALALSAFMVLSSGRIHVAPVAQPAASNVMATVDVALNMADSESPPISPSVPVPEQLGPEPAAPEPAPTASLPVHHEAGVDRRSRERRRAHTGVSWRAAAFLVALAALQGVLMVPALRFLLEPRHLGSTKPRAIPSASLSSAPASANQPKLSGPASAASVASGVTGAAPAAARGDAQPSAPAAAASALAQLDETGLRAPSCDALLGAAGAQGRGFPGAAYNEMREASRALVRGDIEAAQRSLCKAALWDQKNPAIALELAELMLLRRDGASAVDWAREGARRDPLDPRIDSVLGDGLARLGEDDAAKRAWLRSMHIEHASEEQLRALSVNSLHEAQASATRLDFARAERFYRRALLFDGDRTSASNGLAMTLLKLGDTASALRWANRAVTAAPRDPVARVILGDVLFQNGDRSAAEVEWHEALRLDPSNLKAKRGLHKLGNPH